MAVRISDGSDSDHHVDLVCELDGEAVRLLSHTELTQVLGGYRNSKSRRG